MNLFSIKLFFLHVLIFILFTSSLYAQNYTLQEFYSFYKNKVNTNLHKEIKVNNYKKGDIDWYISPFALIEPRPTCYVGIEYFIKDNVSIYTDLGYLFNLTNRKLVQQTDLQNLQGVGSIGPTILDPSKLNYVIKSEIRWYRDNNPYYSFYYGLKLMWRNTDYQKTQVSFEEYAYSTLTNNWTGIGNQQIEPYFVRRNSVGVQFIAGTKARGFGQGIINLYSGVGIRYIANKPLQKRYNPFDEGNIFAQEFDLDFLDFSKQYKVITMDFSVGIRFGGKIKRSNSSQD